jgi:hypothetical protein
MSLPANSTNPESRKHPKTVCPEMVISTVVVLQEKCDNKKQIMF